MEFLSTFIALGNCGLRPFQLGENIMPRTVEEIEVKVSLVRGLALELLQGFFEVA
jgi:hypothetical protein